MSSGKFKTLFFNIINEETEGKTWSLLRNEAHGAELSEWPAATPVSVWTELMESDLKRDVAAAPANRNDLKTE